MSSGRGVGFTIGPDVAGDESGAPGIGIGFDIETDAADDEPGAPGIGISFGIGRDAPDDEPGAPGIGIGLGIDRGAGCNGAGPRRRRNLSAILRRLATSTAIRPVTEEPVAAPAKNACRLDILDIAPLIAALDFAVFSLTLAQLM